MLLMTRVAVTVLFEPGQVVERISELGQVNWRTMSNLTSVQVTIQGEDISGLHGVINSLRALSGVKEVDLSGKFEEVPDSGQGGVSIG